MTRQHFYTPRPARFMRYSSLVLSLSFGTMLEAGTARATSADPEVQELIRLVKLQSKQIHDLQSRLAKVEKHTPAHAPTQTAQISARPPSSVARSHTLTSGPIEPVVFGGETPPTPLTANAQSTYPLLPAAPVSYGSVSNMPSGSAPFIGVASLLPTSNRSTPILSLLHIHEPTTPY